MKTKLGKIFEIGSGGTPSRTHPEYYGGNIPWVRTGDLKNEYLSSVEGFITEEGLNNSSAKMYEPNTVLIAMYGATIGAASILTIHACTNQACAAFKPNENVLPEYLYYFLVSQKERFIQDGVGGAQPNISSGYLKNVDFELIDIDKQNYVVEILNRLNRIIENRKLEIKAFDQLIKARFVEMFGDIITNEKDWPTSTIGEISTSRLGKMLDAKKQTGKWEFPYLANQNVQWFHFDLNKLNTMDFNEADQKEFELREGDLMITEGGEVGRCAVWHDEITPCFYQKAIHRVRCNVEAVLPDYLAFWFKMHADYNRFEDIVGGVTSIAHLPGVKLKRMEVVLPPISLQEKFVVFIRQVDKSKVAVEAALKETQILFDSLMQEYFG